MSSELSSILLGCVLPVLIVGYAIAYIFTSRNRYKNECPKCTRKSPAKKTYLIDDTTGEKREGERDFRFAIVTGVGGSLIGIGLCALVLFMVIPAVGNESCSFEGIAISCVSYAGSMQVEITINLPIAFFALLAGVAATTRGIAKIMRAFNSRGKTLICEFVCTCEHTWTQEISAQ